MGIQNLGKIFRLYRRRPYPAEYVAQRQLKDGTPVVLRPIKPEDEPLWHELLGHCSIQTLWFRFRYLFKQTTHEMATRFCFLDYDRELGLVAEVKENGRPKLVGVSSLMADADHEMAEFALLVVDSWHGRGLGSLLTDYSLEVAQRWGVKRILAETVPDNPRMLTLFRNRGFAIHSQADGVLVRKELST